MTVHIGSEEYYLNHTPVDVDDWQLIMLVPVKVVSGRMQQSTFITFACFLPIGTLIIISFILLYTDSAKKSFWRRKQPEKRRRAPIWPRASFCPTCLTISAPL